LKLKVLIGKRSDRKVPHACRRRDEEV